MKLFLLGESETLCLCRLIFLCLLIAANWLATPLSVKARMPIIMGTSPMGHFAYWSFSLLDISSTTWTVRLQMADSANKTTKIKSNVYNIRIFAFHCSRTNIESYGRRLLVRTLSGILRTSLVVIPAYWNLASVGSSLCTRNVMPLICVLCPRSYFT